MSPISPSDPQPPALEHRANGSRPEPEGQPPQEQPEATAEAPHIPMSVATQVNVAVPTSRYDFAQLANIYNQARVDYIVPMPMNAKRMEEYVRHYDVDLDASLVSLNREGEETGIGMLGLRGDHTLRRGWITRLGVLPHRRGYKIGQFLMEQMLENARQRGCHLVQLEVIEGNAPAHFLFQKLGFQETRHLLIIRRPPGAPAPMPAFDALEEIPLTEPETLRECLDQREHGASWVEETPSLINAGSLRGLRLEGLNGESGWVIFQRTPFQLTHFVLSPHVSDDMIAALLYRVHRAFPMQDTKIENMALASRHWPIFQQHGYLEVFRRIEMVLHYA